MSHEVEDHCLYFVAGRFHRIMTKLAEEAFVPSGLAPSYAYILLALSRKEMTQKELGEALHFQPSTLTRFVDKLLKDGYVHKRQEGKYVHIRLTEAGDVKLTEIRGCLKVLYRRYVDLLGKETAEQLVSDIKGAAATLEQD